jgi:glycosyltransferase involved in cell wall biosynthesis
MDPQSRPDGTDTPERRSTAPGPGRTDGRVRTILSVRSCDSGIQGPENLILTLAEELRSRGIRYLIVNLWDGKPPTVALHEAALRRGLESHVLATAWGPDPAIFPRLVAMLRRCTPDVVHTHDVKSVVAALVASRFTSTPLVGFHYGRLAMRSAWLRLEEAGGFLAFRFLRRVLANSSAQRDELLRWRLHPRRVEVIPSFVDTRQLRPPSPADVLAARARLGIAPGRPVLATVARLSPNKGHTYMLQALVRVLEGAPDVLYLVAGEGDASWRGEGGFRSELELQTRALGLSACVRFLGYFPDLQTVLYASDLVVSPSLREGMQVSLLEAMAAGRPIVATAIGGTPDAVQDAQTGLLVPPADAPALASAVLELLRDRQRMERMSEAGRRRAEERFDARVVADQVLGVCEEVVSGA